MATMDSFLYALNHCVTFIQHTIQAVCQVIILTGFSCIVNSMLSQKSLISLQCSSSVLFLLSISSELYRIYIIYIILYILLVYISPYRHFEEEKTFL